MPKRKKIDPVEKFFDDLGHLKTRCPYCNVRLAPGGQCLNLCLLTAGAARRFNEMLAEATHTVKMREETQKRIQE